MGRMTEAVKHLLIINVILFFATQLYGEQMYQWLALWFPKNENFHIWQIVTHMFMHGGVMHIAFNMLALWMFGTPVERVLGKNRFLFVYFSAGLGAVLFQLGFYYFNFLPIQSELLSTGLSNQQILDMMASNRLQEGLTEIQISTLRSVMPEYAQIYHASMVGASGCIMGVLAAFGMMNPEARLMLIFLPIPIKAKYFIPGIILLDIISALTGQSFFSPSNTAYMAHVGGAIIGFLIMWYWKKNQFNNRRWD
ncbi:MULTISPECIES: rhomboid family intramembrane serine protease [Flagellimonas]|uniref:Rhomboid family intramembrane serine protease n=1 Tax=Flagellimonas hadalis TaxID=2597517 RepID=A0A5N5IMR1_9FLAO|nr:rhomboid family intramembrane serine protease [Allomuricauda hadalis]KAB5486998.1 rhomboid family intramembrane serine protease [Allomuricauda hadalis]